MAVSRGRSPPRSPPSPNKPRACESDDNTESDGLDDTSSTEIESIQDAPSDFQMAISSLWGVFAEVGGYWQAVSPYVIGPTWG